MQDLPLPIFFIGDQQQVPVLFLEYDNQGTNGPLASYSGYTFLYLHGNAEDIGFFLRHNLLASSLQT